jgi:fido (protein-threonine AMPylation protein)
MLSVEKVAQINRGFVYISNEPFGVERNNLDFAVDEFNHSKKDRLAVATLAFRIISTHPFTQGNKRTANAVMMLYHPIDSEKSKVVLRDISSKIDTIEREEAVELITRLLR